MKVFLSWSGEASKRVATALRDWLPNVIQAIDPWMSSEDIAKGARWSSKVATELATTNAGIVCVTPDNSGAPWLNFEAGALSKSVDKEMVCPYLFRMKPSDVTGPLAEFQFSLAIKEDTRKLIGTLNKAVTPKPLPDAKLTEAFEMWWPNLEKHLESIPLSGPIRKNTRSPEDLIEEVLDIVRDQARTAQQFMQEWRTAEITNSYLRSAFADVSRLVASSNALGVSAGIGSAYGGAVPYNPIGALTQPFGAGAGTNLNEYGPIRGEEVEPGPDPELPVNTE